MLKVTMSTNLTRFPAVTIDESEATPKSVVADNASTAGLPGRWSLDGTTLTPEMMEQTFEELGYGADAEACYLSNVPDGKNA